MLSILKADVAASVFDQPISEQIWRSKYQYVSNGKEIDRTIDQTWRRVADSLAMAESPIERGKIANQFYDALEDFKLLAAGRILAGSGTARDVTLCNTFVIREIADSVVGIMDAVKDAALTMKMGGGIGFDFSTIRPIGSFVRGLDCLAAGPLAAMDICDTVCKMLVTGTGRGAMMATLRCDHPDIEAFITAKSDPRRFRNFNLSVLVTDGFMAAVEADAPWPLMWKGEVIRQVQAAKIWDVIMRQAYDAAEPGVLFIDKINEANPLGYLEQISATNSCAEQPLPPNGTCPLASINLPKLVQNSFGSNARLDLDELRRLVGVAVRLLDNVIDVSRFAVEAQKHEAHSKRRIGIGVTGVADALIMLGIDYGSPKAADTVGGWMQIIQNAAYLASANLAASRGAFPSYDSIRHQSHSTIPSLDLNVQEAIAKFGLRNGTLTTIAPTGTISMLGGNVSSGIEPVFAMSYYRRVTQPDGTVGKEKVEAYSAKRFHEKFGENAPLTSAFVTVQDLQTEDHIRIQAAAQQWVDSGISKTVNCPEEIPFAVFESVYKNAFESGCKGCTTYRPNAITGSILSL